MSAPITLNIIGCGQLGKSLGRLWAQQAVMQISAVLNTNVESAAAAVAFMGQGQAVASLAQMQPAPLYLLGCPDQQLAACADALSASGLLRRGDVVFHCSGALPSSVLQSVQTQGALVASVHPVKSFAAPAQAVQSFAPTYCGMEGDSAALAVLAPLFSAIGGITFKLDPAHKTLYHAASVLACNYLVALQELSVQTFAAAGVERELAMQLLQPLVEQTVTNVFKVGTVQALSGPIARGDHTVVQSQLTALAAWDKDAAAIYRLLGEQALSLARQRAKLGEIELQQLAAVLQRTVN